MYTALFIFFMFHFSFLIFNETLVRAFPALFQRLIQTSVHWVLKKKFETLKATWKYPVRLWLCIQCLSFLTITSTHIAVTHTKHILYCHGAERNLIWAMPKLFSLPVQSMSMSQSLFVFTGSSEFQSNRRSITVLTI